MDMSKKHTWNKEKPRKLSLVELEERYGSTDAQIKFFLNIKWPEGFECDFCHCHEYYLIKRTTGIKNNYILECKDCGHQFSLLSGTIFDNSNLTLWQLILAIYLFFVQNKGISAVEMGNLINTSSKTAGKWIRKFRILMAESNNDHLLESKFYDLDILEVGGKRPGGKRGKGADKSPVVIILGTTQDNKYPTFVKLHALMNHKSASIKKWMRKHVKLDKSTVINCDKDTSFNFLKKIVDLHSAKVNYKEKDHKLYWQNVISGNIENNIKTIYHGVSKRDLPLFLAEQEWRFNHRFTGKNIMNKIIKYLRKSKPLRNSAVINVLNLYESKFLKS